VSKADGYVQTFDEILLTEAQQKSAHAEATAKGFDAQRADSNAKAKSAEATAKQFEAQIASAQRDAAESKKEAETEHLARVQIEAAVAWRHLDEQAKNDIGAALASFGPRAGASMWYNASSTEAEMFADDIAGALRSGHITTTAPGGIMAAREGGKCNGEITSVDTGVVIQSTKAPAAIEFAKALIKELNSRGFDAKRQTNPPFEDKPSPVIWVNVESRPRGPQGEFKLQAEREAKAKNAASSQK
jgi:hypothetical protein